MNQYPLIVGVNDLATTHPVLSCEWDYGKNEGMTPEDVSHGSVKKAWWHCAEGHSWQAVIYSRANGSGCPYCAGIKVLPGFNDLVTVNPVLANEWDYEKNAGIKPEMVMPNSNKKYWWKCEKGHSWNAVVYSRNIGRGCPYCTNHLLLEGYNDLQTTHPLLAAEFHPLKNGRVTPRQVLTGSHKKYWWKCAHGHEWKSTVANRMQGTDCPYCADKRVLEGFNDIATTHPQLLSEWDYEKNTDLTPQEVSGASNRIVWWRCNKGHSWKTLVANRTYQRSGCPYCSGKVPVTGENDFASVHPELLKEWDFEKNISYDPTRITHQARKSVWWKCPNGHSWKAEIYDRVHGVSCPFCNRKRDKHRVIPGVNDLKTMEPEMAAEWDDMRNGELTPSDIMPYSNRTVWWKCSQGHHWKTSPNARHRGTGCPYCGGMTPKKMRLV